jgi:poly(ADP-ribose) glycohydrolase ARH3
MLTSAPNLKDRFVGCLLGLAAGDALGGKFEAQSAEAIRSRFSTVQQLIAYPQDAIWYTDDTQMAIGVAEALLERGEIVEEALCRAFVANYTPSRGYGFGARSVLEAMEEGRDYRTVAEQYFPGGSFGNGAAMRVAPVGLLFRDDSQMIRNQAKLSALPTHRHPLGIEGAQLLALAVGLCSRMEQFSHRQFFGELIVACESLEFRWRLEQASRAANPGHLADLGNQIDALNSVPTAIASFALNPESFEEAVGAVILLGGDTDTLAAMTGALSGAFLGINRLPGRLVELLEDSPKGGAYIEDLANRLCELYHRLRASRHVSAPDGQL